MTTEALHVVVPAAGLGTRLRPLTDTIPKEMLPLGGHPAIRSCFVEAAGAGAARLTVVVSPRKPTLVDWVERQIGEWPFEIRLVTQEEPFGIVDATRLGLQGHRGWYALAFPDYVDPHGQGLLGALWDCARRAGTQVFGVIRMSDERRSRLGRSLAVIADEPSARVVGIRGFEALDPRPSGRLFTTFAEIRDRRFMEALDRVVPANVGPNVDGYCLDVFNRLAADGAYAGVMVDDIVDLGILPGYRDAVERFEDGRACWQEDGRDG